MSKFTDISLILGNDLEDNEDKIDISLENMKLIYDLSYEENIRIKLVDFCYKELGNNFIENINRITGMYAFSGTKSLEKYIINICNQSKISIFLKLQLVKGLLYYEELTEFESDDKEENKLIVKRNNEVLKRNEERYIRSYSLLDKLCKDEEFSKVETPCKIEFIFILLKSNNYNVNCKIYFEKIINDESIENSYVYKTILKVEELKLEEDTKKWFLKNSLLIFFDKKSIDNTMYKILCGQNLFQSYRETISTKVNSKIQKEIIRIAETEENEYNLRADAADMIISLSKTKKYISKAQKIIKQLGEEFGKVNNIYDNAQNIHTNSVEESVSKGIEFLISKVDTVVKDGIEIDFKYVKRVILENAKKLSTKKTKDIKLSIKRILMDRVLYSKYNQKLKNVLVKIWSYIQVHKSKEDLEKRLLEELEEMSGTCSSGYISRLINVISGYGDVSIKITFEDQIVANFSGRLNARIRDITKEGSRYYEGKYYDKIFLLYKKKNKDWEGVDKEEIVYEFQSNVLYEMTQSLMKTKDKQNFYQFFIDNMLEIREELYNEFKEYVNDEKFEIAMNKSITNYNL